MAKGFFDFTGNIKEAERFFRDKAKLMRKVKLGMLNNLAFETRKMMLEEVQKSMTIRSPGFVKGSLRLKKATFRDQKTIVGSIKRPRFTGWEEQETGKKPDRKRTQSVAARRGNFKNRVAPRFRLKKGSKKAIRPSDVKLRDDVSFPDIPGFLQILNRKRFRQPFFIPIAYKRLQKGIYIFRANKIKRVQNLNPANKRLKQNKWVTRTIKHVTQSKIADAFWKSANHFINKEKALRRVR